MKCTLCKKVTDNIDRAIDRGWIASFWVGDKEYAVACDDCTKRYLILGDDGEFEVDMINFGEDTDTQSMSAWWAAKFQYLITAREKNDSNMENMVLILSRYQTARTFMTSLRKKLADITLDDIWPTLKIAAANADVVILRDENIFKVLKHDHMDDYDDFYHVSSLENICFARRG